mgnify:CR=1 FL=1
MLYWLIGQDYYSHDEKIDYLHKETLAHDLDIRRIPQQYRTEKYKPLLAIIRRLMQEEESGTKVWDRSFRIMTRS